MTAAGRRLLNELAPLQAPVNDALFDALGAKEFALLREAIARLVTCGDRALALADYLGSTRS